MSDLKIKRTRTSFVYNNDQQQYPPVILCAQQKLKSPYVFPKKDQDEIKRIVTSKGPLGLQILLKFIHKKFNDEGLRYTLTHKVYQCSNEDIQYYVPELVYMAIQRNCKPIKKLLIYKALSNEALRRLIYWNVKAFTVLMKQRDIEKKRIIEELQQNLISNVSKNKFTHSEKAIAMITTASLELKKLQKAYIQISQADPSKKNDNYLKQKLQKFIRRFNTEYLNNLNHSIIIPFRKQEDDTCNSTYVTSIVQDDCSCFPTRKRVPYRIIIQTIDPTQINKSHPSEDFFKQKKVQADKEKDLYDQVSQNLQQTFGHTKLKSFIANTETQYPYVVDTQENMKIHELTKYAKKIQRIQKEEKQHDKDNNLVMSKIKNLGILRKNTMYSRNSEDFQHSLHKLKDFQIMNNPNLQRFEAMYIPTIPSGMRKSACHFQSTDNIFQTESPQQKLRWSSGGDESIKKSQNNIKVYQQETRWNPAYEQSAWGTPWIVKEKRYKQSSFFKNFQSLRLHNVVVKGGDDLRQEIICMQLIYKMKEIIKRAGINIFIKPYEIIVLSENSGILEFVSNSISVDSMKKQRNDISISEFFSQVFETQQKLIMAKQNFIRSLVGSSIITYVLKLKDRHNGNILLDNQGHIIHIDFGFILGMSPGGINFETSPFKLTEEYVEFMGGKNSSDYQFFEQLFCEGMRVLRDKMDEMCLVLEIMMQNSDLQCFKDFKIEAFKDRFKPNLSGQKFHEHCKALVEKSCMNSRTGHYDIFQYYTNNIHA